MDGHADDHALEAQKAGLDAALGLDKYFFDKARAAGKPVVALETAESQIDRFDKMPESLQEQMLRSTLTELDAQREQLAAMIGAWRRVMPRRSRRWRSAHSTAIAAPTRR